MSDNLTKKGGAAEGPIIIDLTEDSSRENSPTGSPTLDGPVNGPSGVGKPQAVDGAHVHITNSPSPLTGAQGTSVLVNNLLGYGHLLREKPKDIPDPSLTPVTRDLTRVLQ